MAHFELVLPPVGESVTEVTIIKWLKKLGDSIKAGEPLLEIATDKIDYEIPSPVEGILEEILFEEGICIQVNSVIAIIKHFDGSKDVNSQTEGIGIIIQALQDSSKNDLITKDVDSNVKLIEQVYLKLIDLKKENTKKNAELDLILSNDRKQHEAKRANLIREKDFQMKKESFVPEAVKITIAEYNKVRIYLWFAFVFLVVLICLNFYNNGFNISHYIKFLFISSILIYISAKKMNEHIDSISDIKSLSRCAKKPPFFYSWIGKPNLNDISTKLSTKYLSETKEKYDTLIYDSETELNVKIKKLNEKKQQETAELNNEMQNILSTSLNQVNAAMSRLEKVAQTCSNRINLIGSDNKINIHQNVFSQQYYFSHFENLQILNTNYTFPIYFKFGNQINIHIEKNETNNNKIKIILRDIIFKNLLGLKFSKLKLTMYDPVELGSFFNDFHKLNKEITGGLVYHTIEDLNEILAATRDHIAMVIKDILKGTYNKLDDYNAQNPDLAEPYKVLIINDFPKYFNDYQIENIKQIISSGPKCGVYTIIIGNISQLGLGSINSLDVSKLSPILTDINIDAMVDLINQGTTAAGTIMVDLDAVLLNETDWWSNDSSSSIELPLGKKGKEIQSLKFDNKDDNQALLIGKPGSGKSNLLHVIILSAITKYGPNDIEIYLIDFKGGVEFMVYAEYRLPQLRTVALESDREFGLSVIEGVEKEVLSRETLFRNSGVQNIEQYNQNNPNQKIPRILFIVDEFQEFFKIEDDIKEQVSLKYDTIIRKGRAFGINSLFSSQTLDGHSMSSSTKELIDIRIALMCGENDVRAIMDSKNLAAKDLSRPGEAIYNAENGKANGNQRFQAVFVESKKLNNIVSKVASKSIFGYKLKDQFIFRGDILAKINKENHPINNLENLKYKPLRLWIGEPVSMNPDYFFDVKQAASQNLIMIGDNKESATVFSSIIYSLKHQQNKIEKLHIINPLSDVDDGFESFNKAYGEQEKMKFHKVSQLDKLFDELNEIIEIRKNSNEYSGNIVCMLNSINKIPRLRLDNSENIFSRLFGILNKGPELGVYCFIHCEDMVSLKRTELKSCFSLFNHRIVFNMSQESFYDVIGYNSIKNLKQNRLVYYTDELGKYQIVKPYKLTHNL